MATEQLRTDKGVSKLARELGVSPSLVSRRLLAGESEDELRARIAARRAQEADAEEEGDEQDETLQHAKRRKEAALADLRELELAQKRGELVDRAEVQAETFKTARTVRDSMLAIPDRVAAILAAEADPARVYDTLTQEIRKALVNLADELHAE